MNQAQHKYLEILRCGLWNRLCGMELDNDVINIAFQQCTTALVFKDSPIESCQEEVMMVMWNNIRLNSLIVEITGILKAQGIDTVLLKGQGCAVRYPAPDLRNCGDLDLYVGEKNYDAACKILRELPDTEEDTEECFHHMHFNYKGIVVELHRHCLDLSAERRQAAIDSLSKTYLEGILPTVRIKNVEVRVPEANFNAVYVLTHMVHHLLYGGIGFRQLCDWTMLLHSCKDELDPKILRDILRRMKMMRTWKLFGYIAVNTLGLPEDEVPFYGKISPAKADKVVGIIFARGNFGRASDNGAAKGHSETRRTFLGRKTCAMASHIRGFFRNHSLFPDLMPYSALLSTLHTGFHSTFSNLKRK